MSETQDPIELAVAKLNEVATKAAVREITYEGNICPMCLNDITPEQKDDPDAIYREVVSWVTGPKLQSPVLRDQTGRIAHKVCVEKLIDGEAPDQEALPGLED